MVGIYECFTLSGFFKIFESVAVFTCLMLHRIGNSGKQVSHPTAGSDGLQDQSNNYLACIGSRLLKCLNV